MTETSILRRPRQGREMASKMDDENSPMTPCLNFQKGG